MTATASPHWYTSSHSDNGGACVEVAANLAPTQGIVPVRDSKDRSGPSLAFTAEAWTAFVSGVREGDFPAV